MYWNNDLGCFVPDKDWLTLTWDVLKCQIIQSFKCVSID